MTARRIAVLQDSPDFGGHERMFLAWLPGLLASVDVTEALAAALIRTSGKVANATASLAATNWGEIGDQIGKFYENAIVERCRARPTLRAA